jgi:hypothetical protein
MQYTDMQYTRMQAYRKRQNMHALIHAEGNNQSQRDEIPAQLVSDQTTIAANQLLQPSSKNKTHALPPRSQGFVWHRSSYTAPTAIQTANLHLLLLVLLVLLLQHSSASPDSSGQTALAKA